MQHHEVASETLTDTEQAQLHQGIQLVRQRLIQQLQDDNSGNQPAVIRQLHRQVDLLNDHAQCGGAFACRAGCATCCEKPKQVSLTELNYIATQLQQFPSETQARWRQRLQQAGTLTTCPFLNEQARCEIYALRPAVCRKAHSYSAEACQTQQASIPQHLGLLMQAEALIIGTQQALQTRSENQENPTLDFVTALAAYLNHDAPASSPTN